MERSIESGNIFSQKYPTETYDKEFCENVSMTSTVFQPPPREDCRCNMRVKWNCNDSCDHCSTDIQTLRQTQDNPVLSKYLDNNCLSFLDDNVTDTKTEILVPPHSNCIPGKELCVKSDITSACRSSHEDSLNSELFYGILPKDNNLDFCMNEQMKFNGNAKEQLVETEKRFSVIHGSGIAGTYGEVPKEQNKNSNNYFQLYETPETITKQNYNKTQSTFEKGQVYGDHAVPDFSSSEPPNCFSVSNLPQNDSFEQICMLNTAISYVCENEIQKIFIKTGDAAEIGQNIQHAATINVCNVTPRQGNDTGDNPNINSCSKVNELKLEASQYFPDDIAKLIYEIHSKLGTVPPSSTANHVFQICETAKEYCEKYSHSVSASRNSFKKLMTVFLQVAYSWISSYENLKDISLYHPDLKNHIMKWKNSSEALLDVLIFAINNWNYLIDSQGNDLQTSYCSQGATFGTLYPSLPHNLPENTSSTTFKVCQYISEKANECYVNGLYNNTIENTEKTSERSNSCITNNNESNSSVNTFRHGNSNGEHMIKRTTNKTESENIPHSSEFLEVPPSLDKKHKNYDTKIPRPFIYHFTNLKSSNEAKSYNLMTNSEEKNVDVGTEISDNVNMLTTQNRSTSLSKRFSKSDFTTKHPGILPIACLEKTSTMTTLDSKEYKDAENTLEHHPENRYSDERQKLKNAVSQQTIYSGRMTSGEKKQMKRPFCKIGGKRTKNLDHSQNCDSDTSETYEYLRPGSYKVPMKCSAETHNKNYDSKGIFHFSFKQDSAGGINNKNVLSEIKTCCSKNAAGTIDMPHKTDSKVQQNDTLHHKPMPRADNVTEKMDKAKSLMPSYQRHVSNGRRPTVYWNKNEHQLPRSHSYYNARQRERFCHKRAENRDRNTPVSSLNSTKMNTFEGQIPVVENRPNFSIMKKCKLENNTFTGT